MTPPTTIQLASRLMPWLSVSPIQMPPVEVLEALEPEAQAHRAANPDDPQAITLATATRSLLDARRTLDAAGTHELEDQQLVGLCLDMFVSALRTEYPDPS